MRRFNQFAVLLGFLSSPLISRADIWFVAVDAPISGGGSSWCDAFTDLQDALAVADADDEIRVAHGTYEPDQGTGDVLMAFEIPSGVRVLGGYAGCGANDPDERDPAQYQTILSGDLEENDGPDFANYDDNSFNVIRTDQANSNTLLDGFTIRGGNADGPYLEYDHGGGISNRLGSPTIRQCVFRDNIGVFGGAMHNNASDATLVDCLFENNDAISNGGAIWGYNSDLTVQSCRFLHNDRHIGGSLTVYFSNCQIAIDDVLFDSNGSEFSSTGGIYCIGYTRGHIRCSSFVDNHGMPLYLTNAGPMTIADCTFENNEGSNSGAAYVAYSPSVELKQCLFRGNSGTNSGALYAPFSSLTIDRSVFEENVSLSAGGGAAYLYENPSVVFNECIFDRNTASFGGAIYVRQCPSARFRHCMFSGNSASVGGAVYDVGPSIMEFHQSTLVQNTATSGQGGGVFTDDDSELTMVGCRLLGNFADYVGGGLYAGRDSVISVLASEFSGNSSYDGGAAYHDRYAQAHYSGSSFTNNFAVNDGDGIYLETSGTVIDNSIVWNNGAGGCYDEIDGYAVEMTYSATNACRRDRGNIDAAPLFVDADGADNIPGTIDDDLRLAADSPCRNAGSNGLLHVDITDADNDGNTVESTPIDVAGHARVLCGEVDMGAHEAGIGDYDCDRSVDITDFLQWQACMTGPNGSPYADGCHVFDFELDHDVDAADFAAWQRARSIP